MILCFNTSPVLERKPKTRRSLPGMVAIVAVVLSAGAVTLPLRKAALLSTAKPAFGCTTVASNDKLWLNDGLKLNAELATMLLGKKV